MVGKRRRSGDRAYRCDRPERIARNRSALLETINGFYAAALDRLPVGEMPALVPRLLKAGLCVGFSDPVSNIIANTVSSCSRRAPRRKPTAAIVSSEDGQQEEEEEKAAARRSRRRRRRALSRAVAGTGRVKYWPPNRRLLRGMPVAERSLEALVAFLTYYFRYLPAREALEYLRLARADLLSAVRLVEEDRSSSGGFSLASRTTRTALKCAALAACHPKPRALVRRSYSLASRMEQLSRLLAATGGGGCRLSCSAIESISRLLVKPHRKLRGLAGVTQPQFLQGIKNKQPPPFVQTKSLQSILLDKIYGFYLQALARLPTDDLRARYHRGLLKAGHCYGPSADPVSNILLNTLWYEVVFPPSEGEVPAAAMVCSRSLVRVACRSLHGLVAFLRACFGIGTVSEYQATRYLLSSEVDLWGAIEMAKRAGHREGTVSTRYGSAYKAAATAAKHPHPDAVVDFFVSAVPGMLPGRLEREPFVLDVQLVLQLLRAHCPSPDASVQIQTAPALSHGGSRFLSHIREDFKEEERFVCSKVNAMLEKYTQQTSGPEYELHVICGLNSNAGAAFVYGIHYGPLLYRRRRKTQLSHINFLARPKDCHSSNAVPVLFFAECSNDEDAIGEMSCWPVTGHPSRCFHCENEGAKIIHPDLEMYDGRMDFEKMASDDLGGRTTEGSISNGEFIIDSVDICEEDCIYFDANRDAKCAEFLNARARTMERPRIL